MIDRGALVLARAQPGAYRGVQREALDASAAVPEPVRARYREGLLDGESVLEDLDEALALCAESGGGFEVVIFEVPQEPGGLLALAPEAPAEGLALLGYDVVELLEPWWSAVRAGKAEGARNEHGLLARRAEAEREAQRLSEGEDEALHAVRVWAPA